MPRDIVFGSKRIILMARWQGCSYVRCVWDWKYEWTCAGLRWYYVPRRRGSSTRARRGVLGGVFFSKNTKWEFERDNIIPRHQVEGVKVYLGHTRVPFQVGLQNRARIVFRLFFFRRALSYYTIPWFGLMRSAKERGLVFWLVQPLDDTAPM